MKNLLVVGCALAVCALLLVVGIAVNRGALPFAQAPTETLLPQAAPTAPTRDEKSEALPEATERASVFATSTPEPLYLMVTVGDVAYEPIPLTADDDITLHQKDTGASNTIHITPNSVSMASATCDNQDCVKQGEVTADNRDTRILGNMIICLPNRVMLELCTAQELSQRLTTP